MLLLICFRSIRHGQVPTVLYGAKVRISERNAKEKLAFFSLQSGSTLSKGMKKKREIQRENPFFFSFLSERPLFEGAPPHSCVRNHALPR
jgi:hypothetical protein